MGFEEANARNERSNDLNKSMMDGTTYFDENESRLGGDLYDEATGKTYDNSQDMDSQSGEGSAIHITRFAQTGLTKEDQATNALLLEKYKDQPEILRELGLYPDKAA